jgi:5-methyltetrahydropteroyltriglutamate--homocysteine methyltransferase
MYRSDVVGSLLRPLYLKEARVQFAAGILSDVEFKEVEDRSVDEAVALQLRTGVDVLTDGEMRRYAFYGHLIDAVEGFDKLGGWSIPFRNEKGEEITQPRPVVVSKMRRRRPMCAEEFTYLRATTDHPSKTTLVSAQQAAAYYDAKKSSSAYSTVDAFLADLVDLLRDEVAELVRLGCTYIQIDSPQYAALIDAQIREVTASGGTIPTVCSIFP